MEGYFIGDSVNQLSKRVSATKSYFSPSMGIAIRTKCISGNDQKMLVFFPDIECNIADLWKKIVTIKHVPQLGAGFPLEESEPLYWDSLWVGDYL